MGIEAIHPHKKQSTSMKDGQHKIYSYLCVCVHISIDRPYTSIRSTAVRRKREK